MDGPADGNRERHVAELPEVLGEPEGVQVRIRRHALLALARRELRDVAGVKRIVGPSGIEDWVGARAGRPPHRAAERVERRPVLNPRAALKLAARREGHAFW